MRLRTLWVRISWRVMVTLKLRFSLRRMIMRRTCVSGSPRMRRTASPMVMPRTGASSIWLMRSLAIRPARKAGEPSMGETTLTSPSSIEISIPTPTNRPAVPSRNSRKWRGSRNCECGSSPETMPDMASLSSSALSTGST